MKPAAVLFDCDGVVVDSEPLTDRVIAANLTRHGLSITQAQVNTLFIGGTMSSVADHARSLGVCLPSDWLANIYAEIFETLAAGTPLIPSIERVFDALDDAVIPYAIGSNGPHAKMRVTLGQHPRVLNRLTGRIFSREDVARPKPAPDLYLHVAKALGARPDACVVIEDSASGACAARAAGMVCFGYAPDGASPGLAAEADHLFQRMDDLPALLGL